MCGRGGGGGGACGCVHVRVCECVCAWRVRSQPALDKIRIPIFPRYSLEQIRIRITPSINRDPDFSVTFICLLCLYLSWFISKSTPKYLIWLYKDHTIQYTIQLYCLCVEKIACTHNVSDVSNHHCNLDLEDSILFSSQYKDDFLDLFVFYPHFTAFFKVMMY